MRADADQRFRRGLLIHGLLERLPDIAPSERARLALRWLEPQGATGERAQALIAEALAVIDNPEFAAAFGPGSRAEAPIVGSGPGLPPGGVRGAVDRLVVTPTEVLIVDFKTDRPAPALSRPARRLSGGPDAGISRPRGALRVDLDRGAALDADPAAAAGRRARAARRRFGRLKRGDSRHTCTDDSG
ncbi:MAG: hypothetical protein EBZ50_03875 [Alphaproteobacteria bacterium]|nr:hypothetical protein [Alphaproteobacteria bacterium]